MLLGLALDWLIPARALEQIPFAPRMVIMGVLSVGGVALAFAGIRSFRSVGTNPEPWKPALHLAQGGIYKVMRNPMYCMSEFFYSSSDWVLVLRHCGLSR